MEEIIPDHFKMKTLINGIAIEMIKILCRVNFAISGFGMYKMELVISRKHAIKGTNIGCRRVETKSANFFIYIPFLIRATGIFN